MVQVLGYNRFCELEQEEIVRGLVKSFKSDVPLRRSSKPLRMRRFVEEIWPFLATNGNGKVCFEEFCSAGGLAEVILEHFPILDHFPVADADYMSSHRRLKRKKNKTHDSQRPMLSRSFSEISEICWDNVFDFAATDLVDGGEEDRPMLALRPSIGFDRSGISGKVSSSCSSSSMTS